MVLLCELLDLLIVADVWDLQELKSEVGWVIASEHKLIGPDTYKMGECIYLFTVCSVLTSCSHEMCRGM